MKKCVRTFTQFLQSLEQKSHFASNSSHQQIHYYDSTEYNINQTQNISYTEHQSIENNQYDQILYSNYCPVHGYVLTNGYTNNSITSSSSKRKHK